MNGQVKTLMPSKSAQSAKVRTGPKSEKLTHQVLKRLVDYNLETGVFTRKVSFPDKRFKVGEKLGWRHNRGYLAINICGEKQLLHRLAFLYVEGYFPEHQVDHKNGIRTDNRWSNLRHVTQSCNSQNTEGNTQGSSVFKGVSWNKQHKLWESYVRCRGPRIRLGQYKTEIDAALARLTFEEQCDEWSCDSRNNLTNNIKKIWPEFRSEITGIRAEWPSIESYRNDALMGG